MSGEIHSLASGKLLVDQPCDFVRRITIDNPQRRNALDHEILDAFSAACVDLAEGDETRCLIVTGKDRAFSAGYDIGDIPDATFADEAERLVAHPFTAAMEAIDAFPFPTIAALNGHALGGGLELALRCDLRFAAGAATVGMPPAKLGLVYGHTGIQKFIEVVGAARTREIFFVGRRYSAEEAGSFGLVHRVCEASTLEAETLEIAKEIAGNAPLSLKGNKRTVQALTSPGGLDDATEQELLILRVKCFGSDDFREGVRAFSEKRPPVWRGR